MRFSIIALVSPLLLAAAAMAGFNCKCQDANGQYNESTEFCCSAQGDPGSIGNQYHAEQVHQCTNGGGSLDNGAFVTCCQRLGHGGAFCWS